MRFTPKSNKSVIVTCAFLLLLASVLLLLSAQMDKYKSLLQIASLIAISFLISITVRYIVRRHDYLLEDDRFVVISVTGKNSLLCCNLSLSHTVALLPYEEYKKQSEKFGKIYKSYNYCASLFGGEKYVYITDYENQRCTVIFECDEYFLNEFTKRMNEYQ